MAAKCEHAGSHSQVATLVLVSACLESSPAETKPWRESINMCGVSVRVYTKTFYIIIRHSHRAKFAQALSSVSLPRVQQCRQDLLCLVHHHGNENSECQCYQGGRPTIMLVAIFSYGIKKVKYGYAPRLRRVLTHCCIVTPHTQMQS